MVCIKQVVLGSNPQGWGGGLNIFISLLKKTPRENAYVLNYSYIVLVGALTWIGIYMNEYEQVHACIGEVV